MRPCVWASERMSALYFSFLNLFRRIRRSTVKMFEICVTDAGQVLCSYFGTFASESRSAEKRTRNARDHSKKWNIKNTTHTHTRRIIFIMSGKHISSWNSMKYLECIAMWVRVWVETDFSVKNSSNYRPVHRLCLYPEILKLLWIEQMAHTIVDKWSVRSLFAHLFMTIRLPSISSHTHTVNEKHSHPARHL